MEGLAASLAGSNTQMYGSGEGQNTTHYYAGTVDKPRKKKRKKKSSKKKGN